MKIAHICGFAWEPKGTVRSRTFPLATELVKLGHEVCIFIAPYDNLSDSGKEYSKEGVRIVNLRVDDKHPWTLLRLSRRLAAEACKWKPDVIHIFKPKGLAGIAAWMLLRKQSSGLVLDCDDWEGWGGWNDVKDYSWWVKEFIDRQERSLMKAAPALTVASHVLGNRASALRKNSSEVFYIPNGLSERALVEAEALTQFSRSDLKKSVGFSDAPVILYAGHFDPLDDVLFFCRCAALASARVRITIAIVGKGSELQKVHDFFTSCPNLEVKYFGRLPYPEYMRVVAASDVAAFPYPDNPVYRAKCSARVIDFMSLAKPIVTTRVGQNPEYLINGESGVLVSPGDEGAFQAALEDLLSDESLRERLGLAARQRLRNNFLWSGDLVRNCLRAYEAANEKRDFPSGATNSVNN